MEENRNSTVGRRAALLLHRLLVDVRRQYYKPTQGDNRGWRRSPLGGNHGNHFYAWSAPRVRRRSQPRNLRRCRKAPSSCAISGITTITAR